MARRKKEVGPAAERVAGLDLSSGPDQTVMIWKATRAMTAKEHESLSAKLRHEAKETGANIVLVPFSVEAEHAPDE